MYGRGLALQQCYEVAVRWPHGRILAAELPTWCAGRVGVRREAGACRQAGQCGWGVGGWSMDDFSIGTMAGAPVVVNGERAG